MYVSPYLDQIYVKNQKIVLKSFLSKQHKDNGCPSFKAFAQGFSIKVVTAEGAKYFYLLTASSLLNNFCCLRG